METRLRTLISRHALTWNERERRKRGAQRLKERLSCVPFYAEAARKHGEGYWEGFYASRVKS
jgi:hypothetical protein